MALTKKLQGLVDRMAEHRATLLASVAGLSETQINYQAPDSEWTIADILHHLALTDEANAKFAALLARQAREQGIGADPTPDESALGSLDQFKDQIKTKAAAPERVKPLSHLPAAESLARLAASRQKFIANMEPLAEYDLSALSYPHPLLGALNGYQWFVIAGGHEHRHARQIERIKASEGFPQT